MKNPIRPGAVPRKHIAIYSSCRDDWGGSEELWARSVPLLVREGARVTVLKHYINREHPQFKKLAGLPGVSLRETRPGYMRRLGGKASRVAGRFRRRGRRTYAHGSSLTMHFSHMLRQTRPDLVVVSQAINFDGLPFAEQCRRLAIPYVIVSQKAVDFYWPEPAQRTYMTEVWKNALRCYFVSRHNLVLTEQQFGFHFFNSEVVQNPVKLACEPLAYPDTEAGFRLACVGRLFLLDKGQDILIRVLARPKWKARPLSVTFVGTGVDERALKDLTVLLGVEQVSFAGFLEPEKVWEDHHGLVLPSRSEGMPLAIAEAMAAGRMVITTNAGGNAEIVGDGLTGFVGEVTERGLDEAMDRAWEVRDLWQDMGVHASEVMAGRTRIAPEELFVNHLNALLYGAG